MAQSNSTPAEFTRSQAVELYPDAMFFRSLAGFSEWRSFKCLKTWITNDPKSPRTPVVLTNSDPPTAIILEFDYYWPHKVMRFDLSCPIARDLLNTFMRSGGEVNPGPVRAQTTSEYTHGSQKCVYDGLQVQGEFFASGRRARGTRGCYRCGSCGVYLGRGRSALHPKLTSLPEEIADMGLADTAGNTASAPSHTGSVDAADEAVPEPSIEPTFELDLGAISKEYATPEDTWPQYGYGAFLPATPESRPRLADDIPCSWDDRVTSPGSVPLPPPPPPPPPPGTFARPEDQVPIPPYALNKSSLRTYPLSKPERWLTGRRLDEGEAQEFLSSIDSRCLLSRWFHGFGCFSQRKFAMSGEERVCVDRGIVMVKEKLEVVLLTHDYNQFSLLGLVHTLLRVGLGLVLPILWIMMLSSPSLVLPAMLAAVVEATISYAARGLVHQAWRAFADRHPLRSRIAGASYTLLFLWCFGTIDLLCGLNALSRINAGFVTILCVWDVIFVRPWIVRILTFEFHKRFPRLVESRNSVVITYCPHSLTSALREFKDGDIQNVAASLHQKILRQGCLPVSDTMALEIQRHTTLVGMFLGAKGFLNGRTPAPGVRLESL